MFRQRYLGLEMLLSRRETSFLAVAKYFAEKSQSRQRHGAVIVKSGRVVGTGYNKDKNHPMGVSPEHIKTHCSRHAEVEAIRDARFAVEGAVLYVARVNRQGQERNSKPCKYCQAVISAAKIKKVIYTESENNVNLIT
jgi:deoxycytidylate deaminase